MTPKTDSALREPLERLTLTERLALIAAATDHLARLDGGPVADRLTSAISKLRAPAQRDGAGETEERGYSEMAWRFSCVLDHATGGRLSKTSYDWETMRCEIDDYLQRERAEAFEEGKQAGLDASPVPSTDTPLSREAERLRDLVCGSMPCDSRHDPPCGDERRACTSVARLIEAELTRRDKEIASAVRCCDSYAKENQQLSDRAEAVEAALASERQAREAAERRAAEWERTAAYHANLSARRGGAEAERDALFRQVETMRAALVEIEQAGHDTWLMGVGEWFARRARAALSLDPEAQEAGHGG